MMLLQCCFAVNTTIYTLTLMFFSILVHSQQYTFWVLLVNNQGALARVNTLVENSIR